jgi:hypothetical protein
MRRRSVVLAVLMTAFGLHGAYRVGLASARQGVRVYELRTYTTLPGRLPALHARFRDHTMRLFENHGMRNEMYWVPVDSARRDNTLIYIVSHESRAAADANWRAFATDPEWVKVRDASEADGAILSKAPDRVFMALTEYSRATSR